MLDRADCADFGCHNSIRLETKHFLNTLALTFISFSGRFVLLCKNIIFFFCERSSSFGFILQVNLKQKCFPGNLKNKFFYPTWQIFIGYKYTTCFNNGRLCLQSIVSAFFGLGFVCYWVCQFFGWWVCLSVGLSVSWGLCLSVGLSVSWGLCLSVGLCVCGLASI